MEIKNRVRLYFVCWVFIVILCIILNILNIDWTRTNAVMGVFIVAVLGILQGSVLEFPLQTIATLVVGGNTRENKRAPCDGLKIVLNYNLLATNKDDINECLDIMYTAYVGNLSPRVSAVLVSATNDEEQKKYELELRDKYRDLIYNDLYREGLAFSQGQHDDVDDLHFKNLWEKYIDIETNVFVSKFLDNVFERYSREFMVVHRVSRVLKKCGQYQDLMLLSDGVNEAFSYCDCSFYGKQARKKGEHLFHESRDVTNILNRKFDYTLVLDGDTGVPRGGVFDLLQIAAAHPDKGIIQPSIKFQCTANDTMYMHLETMRQVINTPFTNAMTALFDQSGFYGKALIKNKLYIEHVIGSEENLIERVPVDVLSHDTFEAALLKPLYAGSTYLLESPCHNYITWGIRERRWNRGEIILATYFWENVFGKPMRWLQRRSQKKRFDKTKVRTKSTLDFVTSYIAHSALRHMFMKPLLLLYICISISVHLKYPHVSVIVALFCILVFPKFAVCSRDNYTHVIIETIASVLQFTPEAVVGSIRLCRAVYANISLNAKWVPQRAVEEEFKKSNPFVSSFKHLWGYSLFAIILGVLVLLFSESAVLILPLLITLLILPLYTGFTSLKKTDFSSCRSKKVKQSDSHSVAVSKGEVNGKDISIPTVTSGKLYKSAGQLWNGYEYSDTSFLMSSKNERTDMLIDNTYNFGKKKFTRLVSPSWSESKRYIARKTKRTFRQHRVIKRGNAISDGTRNTSPPQSDSLSNMRLQRSLNGKTRFHDHYNHSRKNTDVESLLQNLNVLGQFTDERCHFIDMRNKN